MIVKKEFTNVKDMDKVILQCLFPICEENKFSDFKSTCRWGLTSQQNYATWQEWIVERLPLVKPLLGRTEKENYKDNELQKPTSIWERYLDYFCCIEEQRIRDSDSTVDNVTWWADLSSTVIKAFKLNTLEADLSNDGIHLCTQKSICLINFVRKYLEPKMLYSLIDKDSDDIRLRFVIKNHTKLSYIDAFTDNQTKCAFFSDLKKRIKEVEKHQRSMDQSKGIKMTVIFLAIIFLYFFVCTFFGPSPCFDEWWCTTGNVANFKI